MPSSPGPPTPVCIGCKKDIDEGSVIAFGDALFHLDCFRCAKCSSPVDCNSNLLLLADGRPVCEDCSYVCVACKQAIRDEAVMTGEEAYHANCFRCCSCMLKIEDLVFTQTSKGIFCTPCHEYRKSQRQRKRDERDQRRKQNSGTAQPMTSSSSSSSRLNHMMDSQIASDYMKMQQVLVQTNSEDQNDPQVRVSASDSTASSTNTSATSTPSSFIDKYHLHHHPPTPSRSRTSSEETFSSITKSNSTMLKAPVPPAPAPSGMGNHLSSIPSASSSAEPFSKQTYPPDNIFLHSDSNVSSGTLADPSPSPATSAITATSTSTSDFPSLNLSFFDSDSGDLLNLSQSLGANIAVNPLKPNGSLVQSSSTPAAKSKPAAGKSLVSGASAKFNKATELLSSSLRQAGTSQTNSSWNDFPQPPTSLGLRQSPSLMSLKSMEMRHSPKQQNNSSSSETSVPKLQADLKAANAKIVDLNTNYNKIKEASERALDEFEKAKEEFNEEVTLRQQREFTILHLQKHLASQQNGGGNKAATNSSPLDNKEMERVSKRRVELEQVCNELRATRDAISREIESLVERDHADLETSTTIGKKHRKALETEIKSLKSDRDFLKAETQNLAKLRDDVINEMVILQSQNAELTTMNNDLTRRVDEREREAAAVMAGTSFLNPTSSSSTDSRSGSLMERKSSEASLDIRTVSSRDSFNGTQAPKIFKMKKSTSNMFARFANKSKTDVSSSGASIYSMQNASCSSHSLMNDYPSPQREGRKGSKQSNHSGLQLTGLAPAGSLFHAFQATSFIRPVKCGVCFEKMWGLSEYRCQGCFLAIHGKCLSHAPQMCFAVTPSSLDLATSPVDSISPTTIKLTTMLGYDLGLQAISEGRSVPLIVEKCIEAVELRGMDYEGIYRKSGGATQMREIQAAFDKDSKSVDLTDEELYNDICSVTSVLKQYFRELPNPLLTFDLYGEFIDAVSSPSKHDRFRELLSQLPKSNYDTLKLLLQHLHRVSQKSQENRMTSKNLALVFAPTIIRDRNSARDLLDMSYTNVLMEYFISSANSLFNPTDNGGVEKINEQL